MLTALEAQAISQFGDGHIGGVQVLLGNVDNLLLNKLHRRLAGLLLHKVAEVVRRETTLVGKRLDRWQPAHEDGFPVVEIVVQCLFKGSHHTVVFQLARDELAVVKAQAVVEQQLDVAADEFAAELVNRAVDFFLDFVDAVEINAPLAFRHVQGLVGRVLEETVIGHSLGQRGTANQVRVKQQRHHVMVQTGNGCGGHRLHRGETGDRAVAVIIGLVAIGQQATAGVLQVQGIHAVLPCDLVVDEFTVGHVLEVTHRHERVNRLNAQGMVILVDIVEFVHHLIK